MAIGNYFEMTKEIRDYFDGLLMGDGCLNLSRSIKNKLSANYKFDQISIHDDWVQSQVDFFNSKNIKTNILHYPAKTNIMVCGKLCNIQALTCLSTSYYRTLLSERHRWYPNGIKIVPKDFDITNTLSLANWYMGDGSIGVDKNKRFYLKLSTNSFTEQDVIWLVNQFQTELNISCRMNYHDNNRPVIMMSHNNVIKFLELVEPHLLPSFLYKAPENKWIPPTCFTCGISMPDKTRQTKYCSICYIPHRAAVLKQNRIDRNLIRFS